MKRKHKILISIITLLVISVVFCTVFIFPHGGLLAVPKYLSDYFGDKTWELYSFETLSEKQIGEEIASRALMCMQYTGDEEQAPDVGGLSHYYWFPYHERPDHIEAYVTLNKTIINGDNGIVWFTYTQVLYNADNGKISGSWHILTRCHIARDDSGEWIVIGTNEHP